MCKTIEMFSQPRRMVSSASALISLTKKPKKGRDVEWHRPCNSPYNRYFVKAGSIWVLIYFNFGMQYYADPRLLYFFCIH